VIPRAWITDASERIRPYLLPTPLGSDDERGLLLKWENHQRTGSFKLRGALNKVLALQPWERERGLVTASAGNHGQGVAWAASQVGAPVTVFASDHAVPAKLDAMRALGADLMLVPGGYALAESTAIQHARETGKTWVSPYNDGQVIAGQATLALDLLEDPRAQEAAAWIVPVGGGGLIAGVGAALGNRTARLRLIGAQSEASAYFHALFYRGSQDGVVETDSLADGLAGRVEDASLTIPMVRKLVDEIVLVSEDQIRQAIVFAWRQYGERIEGSAAVSLAAALSGQVELRPAVVVITGGNIQPELHAHLVQAVSTEAGR
jgi:threonine dehydratase